ncbi:hypothetical protein CY35_10G104200 [Sphagnum magellanicum]|nr:hypothetical protein CY35_10G104200 [Sphagnum magellanicum]KAH9551059.1 hypothetical protein CY35_10G104200 [Sphagnum magellanicum]
MVSPLNVLHVSSPAVLLHPWPPPWLLRRKLAAQDSEEAMVSAWFTTSLSKVPRSSCPSASRFKSQMSSALMVELLTTKSQYFPEGGGIESKIGQKVLKSIQHKLRHTMRKSDSTAHSMVERDSVQQPAESSSDAKETEVSGDPNSLEREVQCQVEAVSWRERHISASVHIAASEAHVWKVLTDYERLAEFVPNLIRSERIPCPHPGRIWLLQVGRQAAMYWHIEARVVLDLLELPYAKDGKELCFSMVDGDFKRYVGRWYLRPGPRPGSTVLHYEVNVAPKLLFPAPLVERIIRADLPVNLRAMAERAEADSATLSNIPTFLAPSLKGASLTFQSFLKNLGAGKPTSKTLSATAMAGFTLDPQSLEKELASSRDGLSVPVGLKELTRWVDRDHQWGVFGRACKAGRPCTVDEVHLRRFDDLLENGGVHRRVVAAITVEAPIENLWSVLTSYKQLPEFIPNLAISQVLSRDKNKVRLLQEGCKCLLYMVLHARVILDLWERPLCEIVFKQVEGDFDLFQGKWTLKPLGPQHTLLKYVVDTKMRKGSLLAEALVEEVIYEDLPANLCAIRDRVELGEQQSPQDLDYLAQLQKEIDMENSSKGDTVSQGDHSVTTSKPVKGASSKVKSAPLTQNLRSLSGGRRRPLVSGLQQDIKVLDRELLKFISEKGKKGVMPMRCELRESGRVDLEKAIARMGGFGPTAARLNLCLAYKQRKPRGYWDDLQNIHKEIALFQKEHGKDSTFMPTRKSLERAGRYDLARSLEKWGGLQEVARVLGLKVRKRQKSQCSERQPPQFQKPTVEDETSLQLPRKTSLPLKSTKWIMMWRGSRSEGTDL